MGMLLVHSSIQIALIIDIFLHGETKQSANTKWWFSPNNDIAYIPIVAVYIGFVLFDLLSLSLIVQLLYFHMGLRKEGLTTYKYIVRETQRKRERLQFANQRNHQRMVAMARAKDDGNAILVTRLKIGKICSEKLSCTHFDPLPMPSSSPAPATSPSSPSSPQNSHQNNNNNNKASTTTNNNKSNKTTNASTSIKSSTIQSRPTTTTNSTNINNNKTMSDNGDNNSSSISSPRTDAPGAVTIGTNTTSKITTTSMGGNAAAALASRDDNINRIEATTAIMAPTEASANGHAMNYCENRNNMLPDTDIVVHESQSSNIKKNENDEDNTNAGNVTFIRTFSDNQMSNNNNKNNNRE